MPETVIRRLTRLTPQGRAEVEDCLLAEEGYELFVDGRPAARLECLPRDLEELAVGHLFGLGLLHDRDGLRSLAVDFRRRRLEATLRPGGRPRPVPSEPEASFTPDDVHRLQADFNARGRLFRATGAAHGCALAEREGILIFMEDVARHHALDKVVGAMVLQDISPVGRALFFSGRVALALLEKAARSGVKLLVAPGAPSAAAASEAEARDVTLLGFVRPGYINLYTHPRRIVG